MCQWQASPRIVSSLITFQRETGWIYFGHARDTDSLDDMHTWDDLLVNIRTSSSEERLK